jgi:hypothetical protein
MKERAVNVEKFIVRYPVTVQGFSFYKNGSQNLANLAKIVQFTGVEN